MANRRQTTEKSMQAMFFIIATASISILFLIMLFLFKEGLPIFKTVSVKDFIFGKYWYPTSDPADFGIFPLIVASLLVTGVSGVFSIPLGVMTAIYLSEIARPRVSEIVKPVVELLAALPSVVIGFFGMVLVAPFLQRIFDIPTGLNLFNASLMLAFMSIPTICSISEDAIHSVPIALREASVWMQAFGQFDQLDLDAFERFLASERLSDHPDEPQDGQNDDHKADDVDDVAHDTLFPEVDGQRG